MKKFLALFLAFARVGVMTFGGGYAMIPILEREIVDKHGWATSEELMDYYAVGQCTPGVIAVNTATFVGYRQRKIPGGIAATLGVVSPSLIIIVLIAMVLSNFMEIAWVQHAFAGIRVAVCALIASSVLKLAKGNLKKWWHVLLAVAAFAVVALGQSPVWVVAVCAVLGAALGKKVNA